MKEFSSVDAVLAQFVFSVTSIEINVQNEVSCKNVVLKPKTNIFKKVSKTKTTLHRHFKSHLVLL